MASLSETFVTKAYDKKGKKMADKGWDAYKKQKAMADKRMESKKKTKRYAGPKDPSWLPGTPREQSAARRRIAANKRAAGPKIKSTDAGLMAKPIKKASAGNRAAVAKAGEAQRREMARTRLKTQIKKANNPATRESAQSKAQKKAMKKGPARIKGFTFGKDTI